MVSEAGMTGGVEMEAVVSGGDLVMGCGVVSSPPQFTQSSSNDAEIIDPLSGKSFMHFVDFSFSSLKLPVGSLRSFPSRKTAVIVVP